MPFSKFKIVPDGNCLFRSVSKHLFKSQNKHFQLRNEAIKFINENWSHYKEYIANQTTKDEYCKNMAKNGKYGGYFECHALSELYKLNICIFNLNSENDVSKLKNPSTTINNQYTNKINLLFTGVPDSGHYDLLIDVEVDSFCIICKKSFKNENGLRIHFSKSHKESQNHTKNNNSCQFINANLHVNNNSNNSTLQNYSKESECSLCGKFFSSVNGLKQHYRIKHINFQISSEDYLEPTFVCKFLSSLKSQVPILKRIPKGSRKCIAEELSFLLNKCVSENIPHNWFLLFIFPYAVLKMPNKSKNKKLSLTAAVKENLSIWRSNKSSPLKILINFYHPKLPKKINSRKSKTNDQILAKKVQSKLSEGDISGAVRLLCSDDTLALPDLTTYKALQDKHPVHPETRNFPEKMKTKDVTNLEEVLAQEIKSAVFSFKAGSAGGLDGLRPQHIKDLISEELGCFASNLISSLAKISSLMLQGTIPRKVTPVLYGAFLCALNKKDGGIRPIAVGCTLRRITSKITCSRLKEKLTSYLQPFQLGFGLKCGSEAIAHSLRRYSSFTHPSEKVIIKIDYLNAFNMGFRDIIISRVNELFPEIYPYINQCYREPSLLSFNEYIISSERGVQQGDPLGPALFCLLIHPIISDLKSELNMWYLDDGTLAGDPQTVFEDFQSIIRLSSELGLEVNPKKCEIKYLSNTQNLNACSLLAKFESIAPNIQKIKYDTFSVLGCPINFETGCSYFKKKINVLSQFVKNLDILDSHVAYFLLKNSLAIPRISYILRCFPCWNLYELLKIYDSILKTALENICNCKFNQKSWFQCSLPVKYGGLGIRDISSLCFSAFLGSVHNSNSLVNLILPKKIFSCQDLEYVAALDNWLKILNLQSAPENLPCSQKEFDNVISVELVRRVLLNCEDLRSKARYFALQEPESNAWLNAIPSSVLGTLLDNHAFRVSIALRLGAPVYEPHNCNSCGQSVDIYGYHGLSCHKSAGRMARHSALNQILQRALASAGFPSVLEPVGVCRSDGKRADGMTRFPWKSGKPLLWDVTCKDSLCQSYIHLSSKKAGEVCKLGESLKRKKYEELLDRFYFVPFSVETLGPLGVEAKQLIIKISQLIKGAGGDSRVKSFITQNIGLAVQRGNAASVLGTLPCQKGLEEIFYAPF